MDRAYSRGMGHRLIKNACWISHQGLFRGNESPLVLVFNERLVLVEFTCSLPVYNIWILLMKCSYESHSVHNSFELKLDKTSEIPVKTRLVVCGN